MKRFIVIMLLCAAVASAKWTSSSFFQPLFTSTVNDTVWIIGTADDTTGAFALTSATSVQVEITTAGGDTNKVKWYPVYASKAPGYVDCGSVPISKFQHKWGTNDSTDFMPVYTVNAVGFSTGANISPDAACPCARVVVIGNVGAGDDSSKVTVHVSREE